MSIAFLDPGITYRSIQNEIDAAYRDVMQSGYYILGEAVEKFENAYARYCEAQHCVGVASGLDALTLSLRAFDIGPGDEVIVPSHTFIATWLAVSQVGATPVAVEPAQGLFNIDPGRIEAAITPRTRAIIAVHLYGQPADMDPILAIAKKTSFARDRRRSPSPWRTIPWQTHWRAWRCRDMELLSRQEPWGVRRWRGSHHQ
jgi:dTDP-4-amino-4,6-dideoxygalactose transaminase